MENDPVASDIFVPKENAYAVNILRRLFGDTVTSLMGGGEGGTGSAILTTVIGTFNLAILFFATIVATYMMYQMFMDTARDGEAGGRSNNVAVTTLRAAFGAAMLLPIKGGFSVIQVFVLQVLLWGSGLGDTVWQTVASEMQTKATYTASASDSGDSFVTAKKFAGVLATRTAGHLCMLHANNISNTLGTGNNALTPKGPTSLTRSYLGGSYDSSLVWYFSASEQYEWRSDMCGTTKLIFSTKPTALTTDVFESQQTFARDLTDITARTARINAERAVANLDRTAAAIAREIFKGERNTATYKQMVKQAINAETREYISGIGQSVSSGPEARAVNDFKRSFLTASTENGWMFAATWQRALAAYITKLNNSRNQISFVNSADVDPKASATSIWGSLTGYSNTEERLFASIDADFRYLKNLDGAFVEAGEPDPMSITALEKLAANNQEQSSMISVQWLYSVMFNATKTPDTSNQWNDPLIEIQELGQKTVLVAGATIGAGGLSSTAGSVLSMTSGTIPGQVASAAVGYAGDMISYFGYALLFLGFILAIILPFLPFCYFLAGVIGWVIMSIEAVVAAPIWILLTFSPHRDNDVIGTNKQGLLLLIGVFFRPVLMIIGLLACFLVLRVGIDFVNAMFTGIYMVIAPEFDVSNLFLAFGLIGMYVLTLMSLVTNCASLITGLGDAVMSFIGVNTSILGRNDIANNLQGAVNPIGRATGAIDQSIDRMGERSKAVGAGFSKNLSDGVTNFKTRRSTGAGGKSVP